MFSLQLLSASLKTIRTNHQRLQPARADCSYQMVIGKWKILYEHNFSDFPPFIRRCVTCVKNDWHQRFNHAAANVALSNAATLQPTEQPVARLDKVFSSSKHWFWSLRTSSALCIASFTANWLTNKRLCRCIYLLKSVNFRI